MTLQFLRPGSRFRLTEAPAVTGTLVKCCEGCAVVELDGQERVCDFETINHEWVRIVRSGKRRTTITKLVEIERIA